MALIGLGHEAVAGVLEYSRPMLCQRRAHDIRDAVRGTCMRAGLVVGHVPSVVDHVGGDDDGEMRGSGRGAGANLTLDQPQVGLIASSLWVIPPGCFGAILGG